MMSLWKHPIVKGSVGVFVFVIVAMFLASLIPPAWAQVSIPITDRITIDLGDLPPWIISIVAALGFWKSWKAERAAIAIKSELGKVQSDVKLIERNTNSLTTQIKAAAHKDGIEEGLRKGEVIGQKEAEKLAEGQRQGRADERSVAATSPTPLNAAGESKIPIPVTDDRTAKAVENAAAAAAAAADKTDAVKEVKSSEKKKS